MARFVRKNALTISGKFFPVGNTTDPPSPQPSSASAVLSYVNTLGAAVIVTVVLGLDVSTGIWSGTWDSSNAAEGRVSWVVYSTGAVVAATEGFFEIVANAANVT